MRRLFLPIVAMVGLLSTGPVLAAAPVTVSIANFTFEPATLTVPPGTMVTWVNQDDIPHLVNADDGSFASPPLDTGDSFSMTFSTPGEVAYFCSLHPHMTGMITVTTAPDTAAGPGQ